MASTRIDAPTSGSNTSSPDAFLDMEEDIAVARDAAFAIMLATRQTRSDEASALYFMASCIHDAAGRLYERIEGASQEAQQ